MKLQLLSPSQHKRGSFSSRREAAYHKNKPFSYRSSPFFPSLPPLHLTSFWSKSEDEETVYIYISTTLFASLSRKQVKGITKTVAFQPPCSFFKGPSSRFYIYKIHLWWPAQLKKGNLTPAGEQRPRLKSLVSPQDEGLYCSAESVGRLRVRPLRLLFLSMTFMSQYFCVPPFFFKKKNRLQVSRPCHPIEGEIFFSVSDSYNWRARVSPTVMGWKCAPADVS